MVSFLAVFVLGMTITGVICPGVSSNGERRSGVPIEERLPSRHAYKGITSRDELYRPLHYRKLKAARQKNLEEELTKDQQTIKIKVTSTLKLGSKASSKCPDYENLINAKFSGNHFYDPVEHLKAEYQNINVNAEPGESYYTLVLKVNKAVEQGILIPVFGTYERKESGIVTQLYHVVKDDTKLRLVSHLALANANTYFRQKIASDCDSLNGEAIHSTYRNDPGLREDHHDVTPSLTVSDHNKGKNNLDRSRDCYSPRNLDVLRNEMDKVNVNSEPGSLYFKLVLDVYKAVGCNILETIADTIDTGIRGIRTELYRVMTDNSLVRLASIADRYKAWAFLKSKNSVSNGRNTEMEMLAGEKEYLYNRNREIARNDRVNPLLRMRDEGKTPKVGTIKKNLLEVLS